MGASQILFYTGCGLMVCAGAGAVIGILTMRAAGKRLKKLLEEEYGAKRR